MLWPAVCKPPACLMHSRQRRSNPNANPSGPGRLTIAGVLLAFAVVFIALETGSFRQKSATWDEPIHLTAGYVGLTQGDYRVDATHPPFMRMWAALPLLAMRITVDTSRIDRVPIAEWLTGAYAFAHEFLYRDHDADRLLYAARFMVVLLGVVLGVLIFSWTHEWLGFMPAVAVLAFYTFEPNIAAHARLVTTDLGATCFIFGAVYFLWRTCRRPSGWNVAGLAACVALAVVTKFSGLLLGPIILVLLAAAVALRTGIDARRSIGVIACLIVVSFITTWGVYGFRYAPSTSGTWRLKIHELSKVRERMPLMAGAVAWVDERRLLPNAFTEGFLLSQATSTAPTYFAGEYREEGFWYYFPAAFILKTPSSLILLFLAGLVLLIAGRRQLGLANEAFLALPILIYLGFAMASGINLGLRHILPIYPFVLLIAAAAAKALLAWRRPIGRCVFAMLMVFWLVTFVHVYPHTLTFFTMFAGGPQNGLSYLSDSNLDWGQDLKLLKSWMKRENVGHVNLSYFGTADPAYYGIDCTHLPGAPFFASELVAKPKLPGYVAISATTLSGLHLPPYWRLFYSGFRNERPVAEIGNSIRVYWVESWPEAAPETDIEVLATLGDAALIALSWPEYAAVHYRRAATIDPNHGDVRRQLAAALLMSRELDEATLHAEAAVRLKPDDPVAHDVLGVALTGAGKLDAAANSFERALQLAPAYEDARTHLALLREATLNR